MEVKRRITSLSNQDSDVWKKWSKPLRTQSNVRDNMAGGYESKQFANDNSPKYSSAAGGGESKYNNAADDHESKYENDSHAEDIDLDDNEMDDETNNKKSKTGIVTKSSNIKTAAKYSYYGMRLWNRTIYLMDKLSVIAILVLLYITVVCITEGNRMKSVDAQYYYGQDSDYCNNPKITDEREKAIRFNSETCKKTRAFMNSGSIYIFNNYYAKSIPIIGFFVRLFHGPIERSAAEYVPPETKPTDSIWKYQIYSAINTVLSFWFLALILACITLTFVVWLSNKNANGLGWSSLTNTSAIDTNGQQITNTLMRRHQQVKGQKTKKKQVEGQKDNEEEDAEIEDEYF